MRYFIDTNIFVFRCFEPDEITGKVWKILEDYENELIMSVEVIRELLLHDKKVKVKRFQSYEEIKEKVNEYRIEVRYITEAHIKALERLTLAPDHSDPSDLMIISQAIAEKIPLISSDRKFPLYVGQGLKLISNHR